MAAILSTDALAWVPASGGESAENAVVAGEAADGAELHIIRAEHEDEMAIGKLHVGHCAAHIPHYGVEHTKENYDVLTNPGGIELEWVPVEDGSAPNGGLPIGAIETGHCGGGDPFYIARRSHENEMIPGKMLPRLGRIWVPHGCKEHLYTDYEILCVKKLKVVPKEE